MSTVSVVHPTNGTKPARPIGRVLPLRGPKIDHLLELRSLIRRAQDEERQMTAEILRAMKSAGVQRLTGHEAIAIVDARTTLTVRPVRS